MMTGTIGDRLRPAPHKRRQPQEHAPPTIRAPPTTLARKAIERYIADTP